MPTSAPQRILIVKLSAIGDVLMATPVARAVREAFPDGYIAWVVERKSADVVLGNPYLDEVIIYDKEAAHKSFFATLTFGLRLRNKRFDTAVILHPTNRSHIIAFIAGIPNRIGFNRKMAFLLTERVDDKKLLGEKHELDYTLDILENIGLKKNNLFNSRFCSEKLINGLSIIVEKGLFKPVN